jgi:hypothetical protein
VLADFLLLAVAMVRIWRCRRQIRRYSAQMD